MSKAPELVIDFSIFKPHKEGKTIESMVNEEYIKNIPFFKRRIEEEKKKNEQDIEKINDLIIDWPT